MGSGFKNYFWTAQLVAGLAMAARSFADGWRWYGFWVGLLWAVGGFLCVLPITLTIAWARTAYDRRQARLAALLPVRPKSY